MKTKKRVSLWLVCAFVLSLFAVMPASAAANLFTHENVGAEKGNTSGWGTTKEDWTLTTVEKGEEAPVEPYNGQYCFSITKATANTTDAETLAFTGGGEMTKGQNYVFRVMVNVPTTTVGDGIQLYVRVTGGTNQYNMGTLITKTDGWEEATVSFSAGDSQNFYLRYPQGTTGTIYMDDLTLYSQADLDADKAALAEREFMTTSDYTMVSAMDTLSGWGTQSTQDDVAISVESTIKHGGEGSVKMEISGEATGRYLNFTAAKPTLVAGKTYEMSVWVNIPDSTVSKFRLFSQHTDSAGTRSYPSKEYTISTTDGTWKRLSYEFTVGAAFATFDTMRFEVGTTAKTTLYVDDFTIVEKAEQLPVLQIMQEGNSGIELSALPNGAFDVKYDIHAEDATIEGKILISAIYKMDNGVKNLKEVVMDKFAADSTAITLSMTGVAENEEGTYTLTVMLWDWVGGMKPIKDKTFTIS